jgi:hypothetical protein
MSENLRNQRMTDDDLKAYIAAKTPAMRSMEPQTIIAEQAQEITALRSELADAVKALDAARDEYETHFGRLADGTTLGHWTRRAREIVEKHHAAG